MRVTLTSEEHDPETHYSFIKMERQMEQVTFIYKAFINVFAYMGLMLGIDQELFAGSIMHHIQLSPILSNMVVFMGIVMWIIKGAWFVYDHFYLERKERIKKLNRDDK